jgi:hypothetical protein
MYPLGNTVRYMSIIHIAFTKEGNQIHPTFEKCGVLCFPFLQISNRIFVNGTSDLPNVHAIQNQIGIGIVPLSVLQGKAPSLVSLPLPLSLSIFNTTTKLSPALIPAAGIKVCDAISQAMVGNPQTPPPDPQLLAKFVSIGIGPGKTPSKEAATNSALNAALHTGITEGEKLIDARFANLATSVNGWLINLSPGTYGTNYLLRAVTAKFGMGGSAAYAPAGVAEYGLGGNAAEEALYPVALTDSSGNTLTGGTRNPPFCETFLGYLINYTSLSYMTHIDF